MYDKIQIIETAISSVGTLSSPYIDEINSFPSVTLIRSGISPASRTHIGRAATIDSLTYSVRGYIYTDIESSMDDAEELARNLERVISSISGGNIYSSYVTSVRTDEGLFAPYGICDLICVLEWINE